MGHRYIILDGDILTLDNGHERAEAAAMMRDAGVEFLPEWEGEPGEPGKITGRQFFWDGLSGYCFLDDEPTEPSIRLPWTPAGEFDSRVDEMNGELVVTVDWEE